MTELVDAPPSSADAIQDGPRSHTYDHRAGPGVSTGVAGSMALAIAMVVSMALTVGFVVRLIAAFQLSPHVDEPSSLLAAHAVAERGLPILPSGTVYFQGAPLSYLLLPFIWLGEGGLENLELMRMVLVVAGTAAIYLSYRLGKEVAGDVRVGAVMAALVALDPLSVQWSGHLRMYGLLQALTAGLAWVYVMLLTRGPTPKRVALVVVLYWLAVFTHVGAALLGPAMALAAVVVYGRAVFKQRAVLIMLAICALAPFTLMTLNNTLGTASVAPRDQEQTSSSVLTFVGDNLLTPLARFEVSPTEWGWTAPFHASNLFWLVPGLIVAISTLYGGRRLLRQGREQQSGMMRNGAITLLWFYWVPMIGVGLFTVSPKERYLLNVHLLGYLFLAFLMVQLTSRLIEGRQGMTRLAAHGTTVLVVLALGAGLIWRLENPIVHPNHNAALAYVAERHEPGEPVIVALPPVAWLALDESDHDDLSFLAGSQDQSRAQRYTRWNEDDELIDYWVGANAIVTFEELQSLLRESPDAWIVVDNERLGASWAYDGEIEQLLLDTTEQVFDERGGAIVLRPVSAVESDSEGG